MGLWNRKSVEVSEAPHRPGMAIVKHDTGAIQASAGKLARSHLVSNSRVLNGSATQGQGYSFQWSSEVDMYDRHGPGFVGSYLDLVSGRVAAAGPRLEDLHGIVVHDKQLKAIWRGVWSTFIGPYSSGPELVERMARLRAKKGECFILELDSGKFVVAHPAEVDWSKPGLARWLDPVTEQFEYVSIDDGKVWRSWTQLDSDPRTATSDLERALPHIREYINVKLRQDADVTSPLVRNKLIRFGPDTELYESDDEADPLNGMPDAFVDYINLAKRTDCQLYHQKRKGVDNVPFPVIGDDLEVIDMARTSDPYTSDLEEKAVNAFARAVRVPIQYIHAGPGTAKFANEGYIAEALIEDAIIPLGNPVFADLWRVVMRKRMAIAMVGVMAITFEEAWTRLGRLTIVVNDDVIRPNTNKVADVIEGYQAGAATRSDVADILNTQPIDIPPGVSEYDFWQIARTTRQTTAPVTVPRTPEEIAEAARKKAAAEGKPVAEAVKEVPVERPLATNAARVVAAAAETKIKAITAAAAEATSAGAVLPLPPRTITAAPGDEIRQAIVSAANETDTRLFAVLAALADSAADSMIDEAAKNLSRIAPANSDLKKRLAAAPTSTEKLAVVTENDIVTYGLSPETLLPDDSKAVSRLVDKAHDAIEREGSSFAAAFAAAVAVGSSPAAAFNPNPVRGSAVLGAGVLRNMRSRIGSGGQTANPDVGAPVYAIRNSMAVAAGAQESLPAQNLEGFAVSSQLTRHFPVAFEWRHAFYGKPKDAFPEHRELDGVVASARGDFNGYFPADHHNCTCAVLAR